MTSPLPLGRKKVGTVLPLSENKTVITCGIAMCLRVIRLHLCSPSMYGLMEFRVLVQDNKGTKCKCLYNQETATL